MPYHTYQLHQIERPKSRAEILRADEHLGRMAKSVTALLERMFRPIAARLAGAGLPPAGHGAASPGAWVTRRVP